MNDELRRAVQLWFVLWTAVLLAAFVEAAGVARAYVWLWFVIGFTGAIAAVVWWEGRKRRDQ